MKGRSRAELHLGARQAVFLSAGLVIVFALVFILGVLVGRELAGAPRAAVTVSAPGAAPPSSPSGSPAPPPARDVRAGMKEKLTFYQTLTSPTPDIPPPGATPERKVVEERMVVKEAEQRSVVEPAIESGRAVPAPARTWTVQVSALRNRAQAEDQMKQLVKKGYDAYVTIAQSPEGRARFRVRVGSFATRAEAERIAEQLRGEFKVSPFIIQRS